MESINNYVPTMIISISNGIRLPNLAAAPEFTDLIVEPVQLAQPANSMPTPDTTTHAYNQEAVRGQFPSSPQPRARPLY
jgi:hypothetical protein